MGFWFLKCFNIHNFVFLITNSIIFFMILPIIFSVSKYAFMKTIVTEIKSKTIIKLILKTTYLSSASFE